MYTLLGEQLSVYVDDEGLLHLTGDSKFFRLAGARPLAGRGLVLGPVDDDGNTLSVPETIKLEHLLAAAEFLTISDMKSERDKYGTHERA